MLLVGGDIIVIVNRQRDDAQRQENQTQLWTYDMVTMVCVCVMTTRPHDKPWNLAVGLTSRLHSHVTWNGLKLCKSQHGDFAMVLCCDKKYDRTVMMG